MNVLALVSDAWNGRGGIAQYNRDLLDALAAQPDVQVVHVLARHVPDAGDAPPQKVRMCGPFGKLGFAFAAIRAGVMLPKPFVVFCGHINFAPLAAFLGRILAVPVWLQVHGIDAWRRPSRLKAGAVEQMHLVTAVSRFTREQLLAWARLHPSRVKVLPNTVSERFSPGPRRPDLLQRFGLEGKKVLLTVARLSAQERYKGHDLVIEALPRLLATDPALRYLIVGDGNDRGRLEQLARKCQVSGQVVFAGAVPHAELPGYYRLADVFVMPSTGEGFGIAFLEAMASGIPVVGCGRDGSVDALRDGESGVVAAPTVEGIFEALRCMLDRGSDKAGTMDIFARANFHKRAGLLLAGLPGRPT